MTGKKQEPIKVQVCCLCAKPIKAGCSHHWDLPFDKWSKSHMAQVSGHIGRIQHPGS